MRLALITTAACIAAVSVAVTVAANDRHPHHRHHPRHAATASTARVPAAAAVADTTDADDADDAADDAPPVAPPPAAAVASASITPTDHASRVLDDPLAMIATPVPTHWQSRGRRCIRRRGRLVCDGPRRAPRPEGEAAALARTLGIGTRAMASEMLNDPPEQRWIDAVGTPATGTLLWPVTEGHLWRGFGYTRTGRRRHQIHKGIDIGAPDGTLIRSADDGLVIYADNEVHGYGNLMMILHGDGAVAFYAHCTRLYLFAGQHVARGQVIGEVGHSGLARGSHVHFEWHVRGRPRDPLPRMVGRQDERPPLGA